MRELSRRVELAQVSIMNHLKALQKEDLILREETGIYATYRANRESEHFRLLKRQNIVLRINSCNLISFLDEKLKPNSIVLFGSASRGDDTEVSDIDIFVQAKETELDLRWYEKVLNRKIKLLFEPNLGNLSKELLNNIINGQILYGYLKVF